MLTEIQVKNYAVIEHTVLELEAGMTALSGETGAGKSIIVGALGLVLGDRADASVIRSGTEQTEISAHFEPGPAVLQWLDAQSLDADGECLVRRVISRTGRSRAWINGHSVTLQSLRELGNHLVEIHGQNTHQTLAGKHTQRAIVDAYANNQAALTKLEQLYNSWREAAKNLAELEQAQADRDANLDLLRFQIQELSQLGLGAEEYQQLLSEQKRLAHAGRLTEGAASALQALSNDEDSSALSTLGRLAHQLAALAEIDTSLGPIVELLSSAEIQAAEANAALIDYADSLDLDASRRDFVEQRLSVAQELARKHRLEPEQLHTQLQTLTDRFDQLNSADEYRQQLTQVVEQARNDYDAAAVLIHKKRIKAAAKLNTAVSSAIAELGMPGGRFEVQLSFDADTRRRHGCDEIGFMVSANPGQQLQPLSKVASGGELSRISLAIEALAGDQPTVCTMVFDEIDTGVGGGIAEMVGQKMRALSQQTQVLCVTHLPQVASQAHQHVRVNKLTDKNATKTELTTLDHEQRVDEIARMLGGVTITEATLRHAREMISAKPKRKKVVG